MDKQSNYFSILNGLSEILEDQDLRDSQRKVLEDFMNNPSENFQGIFDLATAFGKTRLMKVLSLAYLHNNPNGKIVIATPTIDMVEQTKEKFASYSKTFNDSTLGMYYSKEKETDKPITITTYHSLKALTEEIDPSNVGILLLDEAHHALSEKRADTVKKYSNSCCYGMTGTPGYSPDKDLSNLIGNVIASVDVPQAVKEGSLSSIKNILLASDLKVDLSQIQHNGSQQEYNQQEYEQAFKQAMAESSKKDINEIKWEDVHREIAKSIALFYQNYIDGEVGAIQGKKCMINCRTQLEAQIQAEELNKLFGKNVAAVWTSELQTIDDINRFKRGDVQIVCQVGKLNEGFDMPNLDMCINYPTASKVLEKQRSGRTIRLNENNPDKLALVVDIAFPGTHEGNLIEAIHSNGQVLYSDVIGTPVVHNPHQQSETKKIREEKDIPTISLPGFKVISTPTHLISMYQSAKGRENIYTDMIPLEEYAKGGYVDKEILESHCQNLLKTTFEDEYGNERPLVQMKQQKGKTFYFVTSNEIGLEKLNAEMQMLNYMDGLKKIGDDCVEINSFLSDNGMESIKPYIIKALLKSPTYKDSQGKNLPIVELQAKVDKRTQPKAYIHTNPRALNALMKATCNECDDAETIKKIQEKFDDINWIPLEQISNLPNLPSTSLFRIANRWAKLHKYYEVKHSDGSVEKKNLQVKYGMCKGYGETPSRYFIGNFNDFQAELEKTDLKASYCNGGRKALSIPKDAVDDFLLFMSRYDKYRYSYAELPAILNKDKIAKLLNIYPSVAKSWLEYCLSENRHFYLPHKDSGYYNEDGFWVENSSQHSPVVLHVKAYGSKGVIRDGLGVHQDGWNVFKTFLEEKGLYHFGENSPLNHPLNDLIIPDNSTKTYTSEDLSKRFSFTSQKVSNRLMRELAQSYTQDTSNEKTPYAHYIKKENGEICLGFTNPEVFRLIEEKYPILKLPAATPDMITSQELAKKYKWTEGTTKEWFKDLYKEHETFKDEESGETLPLVEVRRENLKEVYVLNEKITLDILLKIIPKTFFSRETRFDLRERLSELSKRISKASKKRHNGPSEEDIYAAKFLKEKLKNGSKDISFGVESETSRGILAKRLLEIYKKRNAEKSPLTIKAYMAKKKEKV